MQSAQIRQRAGEFQRVDPYRSSPSPLNRERAQLSKFTEGRIAVNFWKVDERQMCDLRERSQTVHFCAFRIVAHPQPSKLSQLAQAVKGCSTTFPETAFLQGG